MSVLGLGALVVLACLIVWIVQAWSPPPPFRNLVYGLMLLLCVLLLLGLFGVLPGVKIPLK